MRDVTHHLRCKQPQRIDRLIDGMALWWEHSTKQLREPVSHLAISQNYISRS